MPLLFDGCWGREQGLYLLMSDFHTSNYIDIRNLFEFMMNANFNANSDFSLYLQTNVETP